MQLIRPTQKLNETRVSLSSAPQQLAYTLKQIGQAIKNGSHYVPLIQHARRIASRSGPKDYLGQISELYDDFVKRWRYVRDPIHLETLHTSGRALWGQVLGFDKSSSREHGTGDCDESASYMGAALRSVGFPVRIVTTSHPHGGKGLFSHVFVQAQVPRGIGWYSVDPVGYPQHGPGWTPPHNRIAYWNLDGKLIGKKGRFPSAFHSMLSGEGSEPMEKNYQGLGTFPDYGLGYDWAGDEEPADWSVYGLTGFGAYASQYGIVDGDQTSLLMEFDDDDIYPGTDNLVRTKMLEMDPVDIQTIRNYGAPRLGSVALGDDGDIYQYSVDPSTGLGFFKKLFKKVRGAVKRGVKWVGGKAKKLIKRLPGGKYLVKLHDKIHKVAMKIAKPLAKVIGPIARRVAPVAALIPGWGPVIAGALYTTGRIAKVIKQTGVLIDKKTGKPKFKSGRQAKLFKKRLEREAAKMSRRVKRKKRRKRRDVMSKIYRSSGRGGRLLKAGTKAHRAYLRGLGIDVDNIDPSLMN